VATKSYYSIRVDEEDRADREIRRARVTSRIARVVDFAFGIIYALLVMRFALALLAARSTAGFVKFILYLTDPFYAPFRGITSSPVTHEGHTLLVPVLVAIGAYMVLHFIIRGLLRLFVERRDAI
jgi:uncharacterized membrane protein